MLLYPGTPFIIEALAISMCPPMSASRLPAEVVNELLHAAADAAIVTDGDGRIVFVNRGAEVMFEYSAEEMVGRPVEMLMPADMRDQHEENRQRYTVVAAGKAPAVGTRSLRSAQGRQPLSRGNRPDAG